MKYTIKEFAQEIRKLYPGDYDDMSDQELVDRWLRKYPGDKEKVQMESPIQSKIPGPERNHDENQRESRRRSHESTEESFKQNKVHQKKNLNDSLKGESHLATEPSSLDSGCSGCFKYLKIFALLVVIFLLISNPSETKFKELLKEDFESEVGMFSPLTDGLVNLLKVERENYLLFSLYRVNLLGDQIIYVGFLFQVFPLGGAE